MTTATLPDLITDVHNHPFSVQPRQGNTGDVVAVGDDVHLRVQVGAQVQRRLNPLADDVGSGEALGIVNFGGSVAHPRWGVQREGVR